LAILPPSSDTAHMDNARISRAVKRAAPKYGA
jgi:hypothetical protein